MPCHVFFPSRHYRRLHLVAVVDGAREIVHGRSPLQHERSLHQYEHSLLQHERSLLQYKRGAPVQDCWQMHVGKGKNEILFFPMHVRRGNKEFKRVFAKLADNRINMQQVFFDITLRCVDIM